MIRTGPDGADDRVALHLLLPRLLAANPRWQRGDVEGAARRCRRALALVERIGDPLLGRDTHDVYANVVMFGGDLVGRRARVPLGRWPKPAGDLDTSHGAVRPDDHRGLCAIMFSPPSARRQLSRWPVDGLADRARLGGLRCRAAEPRRGCRGAAALLERAVTLAEEVDAAFLAGVARHTLTGRAGGRTRGGAVAVRPPARRLARTGSWTQLWIAVRALIEALSRQRRHRDAAVLLGALHASPCIEFGLGIGAYRRSPPGPRSVRSSTCCRPRRRGSARTPARWRWPGGWPAA